MIKAVFMDYTGTVIQEKGKAIETIVYRIWRNSRLKTAEETIKYWWSLLKMMEEKSFGDTFLTEDEIVDCLLERLGREVGLTDNFTELHGLFQRFWMYAPIFEDVKDFFEQCSLPVYIITNNGVCYVEECLKRNHLNAAGIISGEMVRAYKPHKEVFAYALEKSGYHAKEVIHIGDSVASDVNGAVAAGITPILIDRKGKEQYLKCQVIHQLPDALEYLKCL
ncbi:MAG: HAD family hydrolase [Lachnospiraceae bacterium]|nr:HAD family hydrolase [Lachnospiraceae bacterium]